MSVAGWDETSAESLRTVAPHGDGATVVDLVRERVADEHDPGEPELDIAVLLPCHNEAPTIGDVVRDFRRALPAATIYVYDNASTDGTAERAREANAVVRRVPVKGKGNVLRRMFTEVDAAVYVIADGDGTYDAFAAPDLVHELRRRHLDMVIGRRIEAEAGGAAYRRGHRLGNRVLSRAVSWLFGETSGDMLSGFRVLSRRYVKSYPAFSHGFEAETEMTVHALDLLLPFGEVPTAYRERPPDSHSKLRTVPDALRILRFAVLACKEYRPLRFFGALAALCAVIATVVGLRASVVPAWAARPGVGLVFVVLAALFAIAGVIVESITRSRREMKRMLYLAVPPVDW
jgi:hypothetical protein